MLDVRRLRVLREVARQGSLSAAAAVLGYTQPAVSRQIAVLEAEVGVQLLRRLPQGVTLTDAGRLLVDRTEAVLLSLSRTEEELREHAELHGGTLRMAAFASSAPSVMPLALGRFRERHPGVELIVTVADPIDSVPLLRTGGLDIALQNYADLSSAEPSGRRSPQPGGLPLETVPLFDDPMYVALPSAHPLATDPVLELRRLEQGPWMLASSLGTCPDADLFHDLCAAHSLEPRVAFQLGFVAAGVGISVIPDMIARSMRPDVIVRTPDPPLPPRPISAAVPAGYRSPAVAAMLEILIELAPEWVAGRIDTGGAGVLETVHGA
jgi:DNA-binding transcriptional LysR family regulator